jgi:hypothetical protein
MIIAYGFIKLSIIFFYRRLFLILRWSAFDIISLAYIVIIIIWALTSLFVFLFVCGSKIYLQWGPLAETRDQCGDLFAVELGLVISDLVTDVMIITLPMPIVCFSLAISQHCLHGRSKDPVQDSNSGKSDLAAKSTLVSQIKD